MVNKPSKELSVLVHNDSSGLLRHKSLYPYLWSKSTIKRFMFCVLSGLQCFVWMRKKRPGRKSGWKHSVWLNNNCSFSYKRFVPSGVQCIWGDALIFVCPVTGSTNHSVEGGVEGLGSNGTSCLLSEPNAIREKSYLNTLISLKLINSNWPHLLSKYVLSTYCVSTVVPAITKFHLNHQEN